MIDQVDKQIIHELQIDGRRSYTDLAETLGLSEGAIRKRLKKLMGNNVIKISASITPHAIGFNFISLMAIQVQMEGLHQVADILANNPHVYYLAFVTGRYDLVALMISRSPEELSKFIREEISKIPSIVRTETLVNLEVIKSPWISPWDISKLC